MKEDVRKRLCRLEIIYRRLAPLRKTLRLQGERERVADRLCQLTTRPKGGEWNEALCCMFLAVPGPWLFCV